MYFSTDEDVAIAWTPDLFGVLSAQRHDKWTKMMATFVPDELIYGIDLSKKNTRKFNAVIALIDISSLFSLHEKFTNGQNGGSVKLIQALNTYTDIIIEEVYSCDGDVIKFSTEAILVAWKVRQSEETFKIIHEVILCGKRIQSAMTMLTIVDEFPNVNIAVSTGDVIFCVIGDDNTRHFLLSGPPINDLKQAKRSFLSDDLVLSSTAWEYCSPSQYEYVIKDSNNIKITKTLAPSIRSSGILRSMSQMPSDPELRRSSHRRGSHDRTTMSADLISIHVRNQINTFRNLPGRLSLDRATKWQLTTSLKTFLTKPVLRQIQRDECLSYLTEIRKMTTLTIDVIPHKCADQDLLSLVDRAYKLLLSVVVNCGGYVITANLYERTLLFELVFGLKGYEVVVEGGETNIARNAVQSAIELCQMMQHMTGVKAVCIGLATGMVFCGVIGHVARRQYCIFGAPVDRSIALTQISYNTISCDYSTVLDSAMPMSAFWYRGVKHLKKIGKCQVYEFVSKPMRSRSRETISHLDYCYPILGRFDEMECFTDILDDIGLPERSNSGILIQGKKRSGKSRLLDAFVSVASAREITVLQLSLESFHEDEIYSVIHELLLQLFEADDCKTIDDRERILSYKLSGIYCPADFCYLNAIMKVQFPLTSKYCADTDLKRHMKALKMVEYIVANLAGRLCIFLDDVHFLDFMSWQYLSACLNNENVILALTVPEPESWDDLSQVESEIFKDKRLLNLSLGGLSVEYLAPFACQFLNVCAIPRSLEKLLVTYSDSNVAWCEMFLISCLQSQGLTIQAMSPHEASQYDLVFPEGSLVMKIPVFLTPEDLAPPLVWSKMDIVNVCLTNDKFSGYLEARRDMKMLQTDVFRRMTPYQQTLFKCATSLAPVFYRSTLQSIMPNHTPLHTAKAIAELIRIRLLECAMVQRKEFDTGDQTFCIEHRRSTFSDMHHLLICQCQPSYIFAGRTLPAYAHCKFLAFRIGYYCQLVYETLTTSEREDYHGKAAEIFEQDARRCIACGGTNFLRVPSNEPIEQPTAQTPRSLTFDRRLTAEIGDKDSVRLSSIISYPGNTKMSRPHESPLTQARRVSILVDRNDSDDGSTATRGSFSLPTSAFLRERFSLDATMHNFPKHEQPFSDACNASYDICIKEFRGVDYRNCQCTSVIDCRFRNVYQHLRFSGDSMKIVKFLLEYCAGLIKVGQPSVAIKLLNIANQKADEVGMVTMRTLTHDERVSNRGIILALMGDAHMHLGNYPQAKKYYSEAVTLRSGLFRPNKSICYNALLESIRQKLGGFADYSVNKVSGESAIPKLELASYLRRLSTALIVTDGTQKLLKLIMLKSIRVAFECAEGFLDKSDVYLTAVAIFRHFADITTVLQLEKLMTSVIGMKNWWHDPDEMSKLAEVYFAMYEVRALQGELEIAIDIGSKVLCLTTELKMNRIKLALLPSFIEIMVWTKHINEAVDLMRILKASADQDTDYSGLTWYYALCLEFLLDAGIGVRGYDECYRHYRQMAKMKSGVQRDPDSMFRLTTCAAIWQLRLTSSATESSIRILDTYAKTASCETFANMLGSVKVLEAFLMILLHRMNYKQSNDLIDRVEQVENLMQRLEFVSETGRFIRPYLYLLMSYAEAQRRRKSACELFMQKSQKWSSLQGNKLALAWVVQNKRMWKGSTYNNMADYWLEHVAEADAIHWHDIHNFDLETWASILYPLPIADLSF